MSNILSKRGLSYYPNGFTMEKIFDCIAKVFQKTFLLVYSYQRNWIYSSVFEELHKHGFKKESFFRKYCTVRITTQIYINTVIQNVIGRLPRIIFVKINKGKSGTIKCAQSLRKDEKISENVCLLFNEMYLQKYEEYFGGKLIRSDENEEFIKKLSVLRQQD